MSSLAPTKRERPVNSLPSQTGLVAWMAPMLCSTVGKKYLVALTGFALTSFVIAHMAGNLLVFKGPAALNAYAKFLKDLGGILWTMRGVLLACLAIHMYCSLTLKRRSLEARPVAYVYQNTAQASVASRSMVWTGLLIFAFILFHLAHYTFGWIGKIDGVSYLDLHDPATGLHDVYRMTIDGFSHKIIAILYIIAQALLFMHLRHGVGSMFQTLGLNTPRLNRLFQCLALAVATIVFVGNVAIVVAVNLKWVQ
jgi:succinate dehydrogenase / fumarate reductase cytochrome b subunit